MEEELFRRSQMQAYDDMAKTQAWDFLSSFFTGEQKFDTESVEIDVERFGEEVAVDIQLGSGGYLNREGPFTNKTFTPPMYDEYAAVDAFSGWKRMPGENIYTVGRSNMSRIMARITRQQLLCLRKIKRALEVQARQIFFNGGVIKLRYQLKGEARIDFKRRSELADVAVPIIWSNKDTAKPISDIEVICDALRVYGKTTAKVAVFGRDSWNHFSANKQFNERIDQLNRKEGNLVMPSLSNTGAVYHGTFTFGNYTLEMWTYPQYFDAPEYIQIDGVTPGESTPYVPNNKVLVLDPNAKLTKVYGGVPILRELELAEQRALGLTAVPMTAEADFMPYYKVDDRKMVLTAGVRSRPLLVPVALDAFGTLVTH